MTRILHTGDTHLGYRQYHSPERRADFLRAFQAVVNDAVADEVDAVVHAGDLFDDRQPSLTDVLDAISVLRTLADADIPFYGIVGNHESKRDRQWLDLFSEMGLATRLGDSPEMVGEVALYGLDFLPRAQRNTHEYDFDDPPADAAYTALVSHGLFEPFEHGDWDAREILSESPVEFDAMLLGDDHTPRKKQLEDPTETWLTYCGSTERASASEREERGYNLINFDDGVDIRRRGIDTREFIFVDVELGDDEGTALVRERLTERTLDDAVVIITLTGEGDHVTPADIEQYATQRGALVTRINDRRERADETTIEVSFADPDQAVKQRVKELGLSSAAQEIDATVRASKIADSNVADTVESHVAELLDETDSAVFAPAEDAPTAEDETATSKDEPTSESQPTPEDETTTPEDEPATSEDKTVETPNNVSQGTMEEFL